jgi:ribitol 2-dehydrogenase
MSQSVKGKVAVVTGASSGIGLATARLLSAEGAKLALVARSADQLEAIARELGPDALAIPADLKQPADVERMIADAIRHFGQIDILIANAGVFIPATWWTETLTSGTI